MTRILYLAALSALALALPVGAQTPDIFWLPKLLHLPPKAAGIEESKRDNSPPLSSFPNCFPCHKVAGVEGQLRST